MGRQPTSIPGGILMGGRFLVCGSIDPGLGPFDDLRDDAQARGRLAGRVELHDCFWTIGAE
jgi:hypothetical protein